MSGGVSFWLDTLSRELVEDGGLVRLVDELGVAGATSNPTIFAAAICGSDRYDETEGIEAFEDSYRRLLGCIAQRLNARQ